MSNKKRRGDCSIIRDYMPPFPSSDTKQKLVVVRHDPTDMFLRHSVGPEQGHFWDSYGEDYQTYDLALVALESVTEQPHPTPVDQADIDQAIRVKHWDKYSEALGDADAWESPWHVTAEVHGDAVADRVWADVTGMGWVSRMDADARETPKATDAQPLRLTPTEAEDWRAMRMAMLTAGMAPDYITTALESATLDLRARVVADEPAPDLKLEIALAHALGWHGPTLVPIMLGEVRRLVATEDQLAGQLAHALSLVEFVAPLPWAMRAQAPGRVSDGACLADGRGCTIRTSGPGNDAGLAALTSWLNVANGLAEQAAVCATETDGSS